MRGFGIALEAESPLDRGTAWLQKVMAALTPTIRCSSGGRLRYNFYPIMNVKHVTFVLLTAVFATACTAGALPLPEDARNASPPTQTAMPADLQPTVTPEAITADAGGYARAFYRAWEGGDYAGMYSLLSPRSQSLVDTAAFVQRYQETMQTAGVLSVHAQPQSLVQNGDRAEFGVQVAWDTAAVGPIVRDYTVPLAYENGRWGIEWHEGLILPELEGGNKLVLESETPARASIYDINGLALAYQGKSIALGVVPGQIQDEPALLAALSPVLGKTPEDIQAMYASALPDWYVPVGGVSEAVMQEHVLALQPFIGAGLATPEARPARLYSEDGVAPHIVGYTGFIPAEEIEEYKAKGYRGDEMVGRSGVEAWGEDYLNGRRGGHLYVVGPNNEFITTIVEREPQQARSIYTTIDRDFQAAVEQALAEAITSQPIAQKGAIVVMDVNSGAIRAMATYPTYNPVIFDAVRPNADVELAAVLNDPGQPLLNRAAQGAYPAGSVFKLVTYTAGLNSGLFTPDTVYTSTGTWSRLGDGLTKTDWLAGGHGTIPLKQAIVVSCNSCFYEVGYQIDGVDNTLFPETAHAFGFGQPTGIVGISENPGLIPDPDWKLANVGEGWVTGDAVNMAIGQGYVQVTPLQIARAMAAIANGGTLYRPTLIDRIGSGGDAPEEPWPAQADGQIPLAADQVAIMQQSLRDVANGAWGTATDKFVGLPVQVAGKTGTAEAPPNEPHAWFAGYAPTAPFTRSDGTTVSEPEIAIAVLVENAGEGSAVAAPIFRRVVELYYGIPTTPFPWQ